MSSPYIEQRNGGYYVAGTRVSLDSVVYCFKDGDSPETILENFAALGSLGRVYGAIAFYLDNKAAIDQYLEDSEREWESAAIPLSQANPALWEKLERARARLHAH